MKRIRLTSLVFSVLVLFIAACSQPEDAQVPGLESQFGTAGNDFATAVSLAPSGLVTVGASFTSNVVDEYPNPPYTITNLQLRQYTQAGNIVRRIGVGKIRCDTEDDCFSPRFTGVQTDRLGNVYALTSIGRISGDVPYYSLTLYKYSRTGQQLLWKRTLPPSDYWKAAGHLTLDSNDNVYVAFSESEAFASGLTRLVRYSPRGAKMWQRNSRVGIIDDVATAPNGNIYVIGDKGVSRYTSSGGLIWIKAIAGSDLATSGTYFYALDQSGGERLATVSKYGMNGAKLWTTVVAYSDSAIGTVVADTRGNTYVGIGNPDADVPYVQKLNPNGSKGWLARLEFGDWIGVPPEIATYNGDNVYAVGSEVSNGGSNFGGTDAYVVRLNVRGQQVWLR